MKERKKEEEREREGEEIEKIRQRGKEKKKVSFNPSKISLLQESWYSCVVRV